MSDDRMLRLEAAAEAVFGADGGVNGRTLYRAARAGRLTTYLIAGKVFTTPADVRAMAKASRGVSKPAPVENNAPGELAAARARAEAAIAQLRSQ
jgi:hypothetical protein